MHIPIKTHSPLQLLQEPLFEDKKILVYLKRDDLIHPLVQGNKWRKLKYNLQEARLHRQNTLLTFGGPYSNHIYATAVAARMFHFRSIGIIRGEEPAHKSPTMLFAAQQGMELHYMSREKYRLKDKPESIESLHEQMGDFYHIPEGGTNQFAIKGTIEIVKEITIPFDYVATAVGTGGTIAGIVAGIEEKQQVIGFSSLKGENTLTCKIQTLVKQFSGEQHNNFHLNFDYHFGGYAKVKPALVEFINTFKTKHNIMLEPVYTGKMMYGLYDLISKDYFPKGSVIVALHTGGLQGLCGFENYFPGWSSEFFF
jgi:1-aminocyclopropane-1-carboxylate deaminase/D-cysteine desulfhydrase-like pyridoxal-dependent ACC family enzyme